MMKYFFLYFLSCLSLYSAKYTVQLSNDFLYLTDEYLTGIQEFTYQDSKQHIFTIAQKIYTPSDKVSSTPVEGDHPYNGTLLFTATYQNTFKPLDHFYTLNYGVGVRGPFAFAKYTQNGFHSINGSLSVPGWDSQNNNELIFEVIPTLEYALDPMLDKTLSLSSHITSTQGSLHTSYAGGYSILWGSQVPKYFYHQAESLHPNFYMFFNYEYRYIVKNRILEGNDNFNVVKIPHVYYHTIGVNWEKNDFKVRVGLTALTQEFTSQGKDHKYLSIMYTWIK